MENFRKSFISAATKYADYVGAKISNTAEIKELKPGNVVLIEENPLEAAKVLYEEMRTLNQTAEILGIESLAADPERKDQPQEKKVLTYKDGRPVYVEKET